MDMVVSIGRTKRVLLRMWMFLVVAGLAVEFWKYVLLQPKGDLVYFFGLSYEKNLPTWYVSCLLMLCALQLAFIAAAKRKEKGAYVLHWSVLAGVFAYISLDETATLHEHASSWFELGGIFHFGWVIPAACIVATIALCYLRFLAHLPRATRLRFVTAGAIYVGGALGVELGLGYWTDLAGEKNIVYGLIDLVEESMEILGVTLFLIALANYIGGPTDRLIISLRGVTAPVLNSAATRAQHAMDVSDAPASAVREIASDEACSQTPDSEEDVAIAGREV